MHFRIETINKKGQEVFPILETMTRMLYKLGSLQYLILVFDVLLTQCHGLKSSQSLEDKKDKRLQTHTCLPQVKHTYHHDLVPP